jgi:fumarate reductase subunit C
MEKFFYLGQIFGVINTIGEGIALIAIIATCVFLIFYFCASAENDESKPIFVKGLKASIIASIIACIIATLVPSKQTWYLMKGGEIVDTLNEGGRISKTAEKTLDLINNYLDEQLERMKE